MDFGNIFNNLILGFGVAVTPIHLLYALIGVLLGTLIGVLPGIGPVATIAMLLPATYALPPVAALIMLAGIYYGAQYGGSTTAILVNLPGESSSVVTVIDGYQMARKGRAGPALAAAGLGSFFAGCVGTLILAAFAPPLTELAFKFGPAEYFSLMVLGLIGAVVLVIMPLSMLSPLLVREYFSGGAEQGLEVVLDDRRQHFADRRHDPDFYDSHQHARRQRFAFAAQNRRHRVSRARRHLPDKPDPRELFVRDDALSRMPFGLGSRRPANCKLV